MGDRIKRRIAYTEILEDGQRCSAAILEYEEPVMEAELDLATYEVDGRTIVDVYTAYRPKRGKRGKGSYVVIELDISDPAADTLEPVPGSELAKWIPPVLWICQKKQVRTEKGDLIEPWKEKQCTTEIINDAFDAFEDLSWYDAETGITIPYRLCRPKAVSGEKYGLILFFHGGAECGEDNYLQILRSQGAAIWATEEQQEEFPCYVLAPQFPLNNDWIDPDTYEEGKYLEIAYRLTLHIIEENPVDTSRLYASGHSMGAMSTWLLNSRYPDMFAAMLITVGQGDYERVGVLKDKPIWAWNAENDDKAAEGLGEIMNSLELSGGHVIREYESASKSVSELEAYARNSLQKEGNIRHTQWIEGTLKEKWAHYGWKEVYNNRVVRRWLTGFVNGHYSPARGEFDIQSVLTPQILPVGDGLKCRQVSAGCRHTLILTEKGVYGFGSNCNGQLGQPSQMLVSGESPVLMYANVDDVAKVCAGNNFSAVLLKDGTVLTCGENAKGQLGRRKEKGLDGLAVVEGLSDIIDLETGTNVMFALRRDGTVWACGDNSTGQLSDGTYLKSSVPKPLMEADGKTPLSGAISISCGMRTAFIGREDGTWWAVGNGEYGQRGDGTEGHGPAPTSPGLVIASDKKDAARDVIKIGAARCFTLLLKKNGDIYALGWNIHGDLGFGDDIWRLYPEKNPYLSNIVDISCGMNHSLALDKNGDVWTWGFNKVMSEGALGVGDKENRTIPVKIPGLPKITAISAGYSYSILLDEKGNVWGFGNANNNRLLLSEV